MTVGVIRGELLYPVNPTTVKSLLVPLKFSAPQQHKKKQVEAQMFMYRRVHRTGYDFFLQLLAATCSCSKHVRLKP